MEVPCIRLGHLTETQRKAYIIADNRLALNAGWDDEMLKIEIADLLADGFTLSVLGFDADELQKLLDVPDFEPATQDDQSKLDELEPKWIACPHCGKEFDARQT
jgi:hypothetical protein